MNSRLKFNLFIGLTEKIVRPLRSISSKLRAFAVQAGKSFKQVADKARETGKAMSDIGGHMTAKISTAILGLGTASVVTSAKFEDLRAAMETAAGSAEKGNQEFERMLKFVETTPFQLEEVMTAYIKLKNLGIDPTNEALRSYGNTSSAMMKSLDQMIEAVADATTGEFERLKEFGIKTRVEGNRVAFTFQKQTTIVRNSAEEIEKYLLSIGNEKFGNSMEKRLRGFNGILSNFFDGVSASLAGFGDDIIRDLDLKQFFKDLTQGVRDLLTAFRSLPAPMQGFIIKGGLVVALIGPLLMGFGQLAIGLGLTFIGFSKLLIGITLFSTFVRATLIPTIFAATKAILAWSAAFLATPFGMIVAGIAAIATAGYLIIKHWDKVKLFWSNLWDGITRRVNNAAKVIMPIINRISKGYQLITDNAITRGIGSASDYMFGSDETPRSLPGRSRVDTGGELRIVIDENRPTRVRAKLNNTQTNVAIDQGVLMGGAL